ncbi:hypothetical protein HPB49_019508 [Dermacentor silvarum]|uniref:Uncharacterized protein n=1 Tax=Dermacentor silvarum TaxID=543639 RepID=A0ACB8E2G2_DERSI|nr:hypothetical protein HPB49_019508 [Dermacentor silvarum]
MSPPSGAGGIAANLLAARGPLAAAQARTQLYQMRKKWRKEGYSVVGTISFAVLIVAFILLLVMLTRMFRSKRTAHAGCNNAACKRYAAALTFSRQEHSDPCYSFYRYVCGRWGMRRFDSVRDILLNSFRTAVTDMAIRTQAPAQFQNPSQRAARAYTSCISVLDRKDREVGELKAILYNADLRWPQRASTGNVLSPFIYLCKDWSLLFIFGFTKDYGGGYTLSPTGQFEKLLEVWEQALYNSKHTKLFNILYEDHVTDESTAITYTEMATFENKTIAALRKVKNMYDSRNFTSYDISHLAPHLRRGLWKEALKTRLGVTPAARVPIRVRQASFVSTFLGMTSDGGANLMLYMGWVVAVLFSIYTDSQIMTEFFYGTRDAAETKHKELCFQMVQKTMGFALNADYTNLVAPAQVRADVTNMIGNLHFAFTRLLSGEGSMFPSDVQLTGYENSTGAIFEYVDHSSNVYLTRVFSAFTDMSPLLSKTWEAINKGFSSVLPSEVSPWPLRAIVDKRTNRKMTLLSRLDVAGGYFSLMPYTFAYPVYDLEAPVSIRYGALGSEVASSMAALLFANVSAWNSATWSTETWDATASNDTGWNVTHRDEVMDEITCFFRKRFNSWDSVTAVEWSIIYRLASVGALWEAYLRAKDNTDDYLSGHKYIRSDQLFFFFWCYLQCGEPAGESSCNGPLKHFPAFARTFKCHKGTPMSMDWRCGFFH